MTTDTRTQKERLAEPFPQQILRDVRKGGTSLTYVPIAEVVARVNNVIGPENWGMEIIACYRDALDPDFVVAHVAVTATIDGVTSTKHGVGGQSINRTRDGKIVDLGNDFKGAVSDAEKKAWQQNGVGLELARKDDALAFEAEQKAAEAAAAPRDPSLVNRETWDTFLEHAKSANDLVKQAVRKSVTDRFPTVNTKSFDECTQEAAEFAIGEFARYKLGATWVEGEAAPAEEAS